MLRPISFSALSSTQLRISFNKNLSNSIVKENFLIESIDGHNDGLEITEVEVSGSSVTLRTRPQASGNFYLLRLVDIRTSLFIAEDGTKLINDDKSRLLYFVGISNRNPVKDSIYQKVPGIYSLQNSNISNLIDNEAAEIYKAQKNIGDVLSDNYISEVVTDELRVRTSGATDRLGNEGVYSLDRVSKNTTGESLTFGSLDFTESSTIEDQIGFPEYPVALSQEYVASEEVSLDANTSNFNGFLLTLSKKNIISVKDIIWISSEDLPDCNGQLGTSYSIKTYKYSIRDNKYDPKFAFSNNDLDTNQVLISPFGNIQKPKYNDKFIVSYIYKDLSKRIDEDSIEVFNIKTVSQESIPTNITRFFLKNAPIVTQKNTIPELGGVSFFTTNNSEGFVSPFRRELVFNSSKLPSEVGEYSVNYETGEVIVVGSTRKGEGTGSYLFAATYLYKNSFTKNLDYYLDKNDIVATPKRPLAGEPVSITFSYEKIFVEGVDYRAPCHVEVMNEEVLNDLSSSFSIRTKNHPITNVFKIFNQTTGEVYNSLYFSDTDIFFTGRRSPELKDGYEIAKFEEIKEENLFPTGSFVIPTFSVQITKINSNSNIEFSPPIPKELIDSKTTYYIRSFGPSGSGFTEDIPISFFGPADSNNLVSYLGISLSAQAPSLFESVDIGPAGYSFSLKNDSIISQESDKLGTLLDSSVDLSNSSIFSREKFFKSNDFSLQPNRISNESLLSSFDYADSSNLKENLKRLNAAGDYSVDYKFGKIYVATNEYKNEDFGTVSYKHNKILTNNKNVISVTEASRKINEAGTVYNSVFNYNNFSNDYESIRIDDLEPSTSFFNNQNALDLNNSLKKTNVILDDYTVVLANNIKKIKTIISEDIIFGSKLGYVKQSDRIQSLDSLALITDHNIWSPNKMQFEDNVVDLKRKITTRASLTGNNFVIQINDANISQIYSSTHESSGNILFDEKLNIVKIYGLDIVSIGTDGLGLYAEVRSGVNLSVIDLGGDFLLDSIGSRYKIIGTDELRSRIYVEVPAENASDKFSPELGAAEVVNKVSIQIDLDKAIITIPSDSFLAPKDLVTIEYVTSDIPAPGTKVAVNYNYGSLFIGYKYCYDDIYVSYEYGDNEIDWSISDSILEGEEYYVSYKYGALRTALRNNFGLLTKIPFFQDFSLTTNRELYRSALKGTLQAFSGGPTKSSFGSLIKSFTDMDPEIQESLFNSWILGRDYLEPDGINISGPIEFYPAKHNEGIFVGEGTEITTSAISNFNLSEGTLSTWMSPSWNGIDNDAEIQISLDNIGDKSYHLAMGTDLFNVENNFSMSSFKDDFSILNSSGDKTFLNNKKIQKINNIEEPVYTTYALYKEEKSLNRFESSSHNVSFQINEFNIDYANNILLSDPTNNSEYFGLLGSNVSANILSLFNLFSFEINDKNKNLNLNLSLAPFFEGGSIVNFIINDSLIQKSNIDKYDGPYKTVNCKCVGGPDVENLLKFNDPEFNLILVSFESVISSLDCFDQFEFLDYNAKNFVFIDEQNKIFKVEKFIDQNGDLSDKIPALFKGVALSRIPQNMPWATALSSDEINDLRPIGSSYLALGTVTLLTTADSASSKIFGYQEKSFAVDILSGQIDFEISRNPRENLVHIKINENVVDLFYSDLIDSSFDLYSLLGYDKNVNSNNSYIAMGTYLDGVHASVEIKEFNYLASGRFHLKDVYIGKNGLNPKRNPFTISKNEFYPINIEPYNLELNEGVFIWYDEECGTDLTPDSGSWKFRTRIADSEYMPVGVTVFGDEYSFDYEKIFSDFELSGSLITDGEFSSVKRTYKKDSSFDCNNGEICSAEFRYCGDGLLEETGWVKINETSSDIINVLLGGSQNDKAAWVKTNNFNSSNDGGIYSMGPSLFNKNLNGKNSILAQLPCYTGDYSVELDFRVDNYNNLIGSNQPGYFSGIISGNLLGITPIHIFDENINLKITLAKTELNEPALVVFDAEADAILDIVYYDWSNGLFNKLILRKNDNAFFLETETQIISRFNLSDFSKAIFDECNGISSAFIGINIFDSELLNSGDYHNLNEGNKISLSYINFSGVHLEGEDTLEADDILISTDSKIEFLLTTKAPIDGYSDGYSDGYDGYSDGYDGYITDIEYDVDEIRFTSDKIRYLFDSGETDSKNRISLFKDGKGFLNFRIYDNGFNNNGASDIYNIAKNIKDFKAGELHHIAVSWRLNTLYEKDEMHLFVDGLEVPNLFKFGGSVKTKVNDKFSDIGKEILQDGEEDLITYYDEVNDGTILAGSSIFYSDSFAFTDDLIGRAIIFRSSNIAQIYIGKKYILGQRSGSGITILDADTLSPVLFQVSASDISFSLAPTAGIKREINTDLVNSNYSLFITKCNGEEKEIGGIKYSVDNGQINILNEETIINPMYRVNLTHGLIEFVGVDESCNWSDSVEFSDLDIHIKTYGLLFRGINERVSISSSSYTPSAPYEDNVAYRGAGYDVTMGGKSIFMSHAVEPVKLSSVKITKIIKDRFIPSASIVSSGEFYQATFSEGPIQTKLTSEEGRVGKINRGRYLSLTVDSDNIVFCEEPIDGYSPATSIVTVKGKTVDGSNFEEFSIYGNGKIDGKKIFLSVDSIEGDLLIADPDYEIGVIELMEKDSIDIQNNNGEYAEVFRYINGSFQLSSVGTGGTIPFELTSGSYIVNYPAYLNIKIPRIGERLFIGSDLNGNNAAASTIDDLKIITEMSSDTRPFEKYTRGTRSITEEWISPNPACPDNQTLLLVDFDNPIELQARRLRQKEFLNRRYNYKYKLDLDDREDLLLSINNQEEFESKMMRKGFDLDEAKSTFIECHHAQGGPLFNDAKYLKNEEMNVSSTSVNSLFGLSAKFNEQKPLIISNNNSYFRKNGGTIEFWVSPILDTYNDYSDRYYLDIFSAETKRVKSLSPTLIRLPNAASRILSIKLLDRTSANKGFYTDEEASRIIFDELYRGAISGVLEGGSGVGKDYLVGSALSPNGKEISLKEALPGFDVDVLVTYVPAGSGGERVSVYKNKNSQIIFSILTASGERITGVDVDWKRNTWHKIRCVWRANSSNDYMRLFVDGEAKTSTSYGDPGLTYGLGSLYGESPNSINVKKTSIRLKDDFKVISIGGSGLGRNSALARMDNIRFSRIIRDVSRSPSGDSIDLTYSPNLNTVLPLINDDGTTLLVDFGTNFENENYAIIIDPKRGIFNFDIEVFDEFNKINSEEIEDLIVELVERLKPSHTNALVKFPRKIC